MLKYIVLWLMQIGVEIQKYQKSVTGCSIFMAGAPVLHKSKMQPMVA